MARNSLILALYSLGCAFLTGEAQAHGPCVLEIQQVLKDYPSAQGHPEKPLTSLDEIIERYGLPRHPFSCGQAARLSDKPFGPFLAEGEQYDYGELEEAAKHPSRPGQTELFFGLSEKNSHWSEVSAVIRKHFTEPVGGNEGHGDVLEHNGLGASTSGFSNYSESFNVAKSFAGGTGDAEIGIVFVTDTRDLELLNLEKFSSVHDPRGGGWSGVSELADNWINKEKELLSRGVRNPRRIKAAIVLKNGMPVEIWTNPNFDSGVGTRR